MIIKIINRTRGALNWIKPGTTGVEQGVKMCLTANEVPNETPRKFKVPGREGRKAFKNVNLFLSAGWWEDLSRLQCEGYFSCPVSPPFSLPFLSQKFCTWLNLLRFLYLLTYMKIQYIKYKNGIGKKLKCVLDFANQVTAVALRI